MLLAQEGYDFGYIQVLMVLLPQGISLFLSPGLKTVPVRGTLSYKSLVVNCLLQNKIFLPSMWLLGMVIMFHIRQVSQDWFQFLTWWIQRVVLPSFVLNWTIFFCLQYDLNKFCPYNTVLLDHSDPSINTGSQFVYSYMPLSFREVIFTVCLQLVFLQLNSAIWCSSDSTN